MNINNDIPNIKVLGVGGAGINAVNRMIDTGMSGVEFIAIDFDPSALARSKAKNILQLESIYPGLTFPEFGDPARLRNHESALTGSNQIRMAIGKADVVFIVAGMGGGTGSGASPVIAETAKQTGALTIAVVTLPFGFEGKGRLAVAKAGLKDLCGSVDTVIVIPDEGILEIAHEKEMSLTAAFQSADDYLCLAVQCIVDLTIRPYSYPISDSPVPSLLRSETNKLLTGDMSVGYGTGNDRATNAAKMVNSSPLLKRLIKEAQVVLIDLRASPDFRLYEVGDAVDMITGGLDKNREVIWDTGIAQNLKSEIDIIAIFLYIDNEDKPAD